VADRDAASALAERRQPGRSGPNKEFCRFPHLAHKRRANDDELSLSKVRQQPENLHEH
jgi:hypothetical protein